MELVISQKVCWFLTMISCTWAIPQSLRDEIHGYQNTANLIIAHLRQSPSKHEAYNRLAELTDTYGSRMTGSQALEDAIDYLHDKLNEEFGPDNAWTEDVTVEYWHRGREEAKLIKPYERNLYIMGLGYSVPTPPTGIHASVVVVTDFNELEMKKNEISGKIVVFNQAWEGYSNSVQYRVNGARNAAQYGAAAVLIRSVADLSIYSPHTGVQYYNTSYGPKIPTGCITIEDAELIQRMYHKDPNSVEIYLYMNHTTISNQTSRNVIAEIKGSEKPHEIVLFSGHLDSWDVGVGAMDDGGGVAISWEVLSVIKRLNLTPKRTMRVVLWTGEEDGIFGGHDYYNRHKADIGNYSLVMESDYGTFKPNGLEFSGSQQTLEIIEEIASLMKSINAAGVRTPYSGADIQDWSKAGVPAVSLWNQADKYFYYHHTEGDMMTVQDPDIMDQCAMVWTIAAYVTASLSDKLPHLNDPAIVTVGAGCRPAMCPWFLVPVYIMLALIVCRKTR